ncbi:MAG: hypothetical protein JNL01_12825 [Bdellovibrionales bacterium]|nr:hypothetical protein [Bdellovibrionales bacterium]
MFPVLLRQFIVATIPLIIWASTSFALPPERRPLSYQTFEKAAAGLSSQEGKHLREIFDEFKVLDLRGSLMYELESFLETVNERLTRAAEKLGNGYPQYRLSILASPEIKGFVIKHRTPGHSNYRAHVFISAGLVKRFFDEKGYSIQSATPAQMDEILNRVVGVLGHEYVHPKEDELIKWEVREGQDQSRQNHGQFDEMATDLMAIRILKDAGFAPENGLYALESLFGSRPPQQARLSRAFNAALSSHPEDEIRLNIIRGALLKLRMSEGTAAIKPIAFDSEKMRGDLSDLLIFGSVTDRISLELSQATGNPFLYTVKSLMTLLSQPASGPQRFTEEILGHFRYLAKLDPIGSSRTPEEIQAFSELSTYLIHGARLKLRDKNENSWHWLFDHSGFPPGERGSPKVIREYQEVLNRIGSFQDPRYRKKLKEFLGPNATAAITDEHSNYEYLGKWFPRNIVEELLIRGLKEADAIPLEDRADILVRMLHTSVSIGLSPEYPTRILKKMIKGLEEGKAEGKDAFFKIYHTSIENVDPLRYGDPTLAFHPEFFHEQFVRYNKTHPQQTAELLDAYAALYKAIFSDPSRSAEWAVNDSTGFKVLSWHFDETNILLPFHKDFPVKTQKMVDWIRENLKSKEWKKVFQEAWKNPEVIDGFRHPVTALVGYHFSRTTYPYSVEQRINLYRDLLQGGTGKYDRKHLDYYIRLLHQTYLYDELFPVYLTLFRELNAALGDPSLIATFEKFTASFRNLDQMNQMVAFAHAKGSVTDTEYYDYLDKNYFLKPSTLASAPLMTVGNKTAAGIYRQLRKKGVRGKNLVETLLARFQIEKFDAVAFDRLYGANSEHLKFEIEHARQLGLRYSPHYGRYFGIIAQQLKGEFAYEFGFKAEMTPQQYRDHFIRNLPAIQTFFGLLFNPDQKSLSVETRPTVDFYGLNDLASTFVSLIPDDLPFQEIFSLWKNFGSKHVGRYSDQIYRQFIRPKLDTIPGEWEGILESGLIQSDRLRTELFEKTYEKQFQKLAEKSEKLRDSELDDFIRQMSRLVPNASGTRDDYLERIAWEFELNESQTQRFIEPLKSFNFKAIDPAILNVLSVLRIAIEQLSIKEKARFLGYIQDPQGSIYAVLPTLNKGRQKIMELISRLTGSRIDEAILNQYVAQLENYIRDAKETERLVLNEMIIGTRTQGLYHQGEEARKEIYELAGLTHDKLPLFKAYVAALPEHERTLILSYILATRPEEGDGSQLLRIFELHNTAGIKFAQMASILSIFGEEESEKLAHAKNRSNPPTRADVFKLMRERYSSREYENIKSVKSLAGTGGIKYVVFVEFIDGTTEAVYLRRPYLDQTIDDTLSLAARFAAELRLDPEYASAYDYDYYLRSLREQLATESQFKDELEKTKRMSALYGSVKPIGGWRFQTVPPSSERPQRDDIMHFSAVRGTLPFESLSDEDKKAASLLIVETELDFLFNRGEFDADRHLGNYLFDPHKRVIYPIDFSQTYRLKENRLTEPGGRYFLARMIYGLSQASSTDGARILAETLYAIIHRDQSVDPAEVERIQNSILATMSEELPLNKKMLKVLGQLTSIRVYLPPEYSLGLVKALSILTQEKYSRYVPEDLIRKRIAAFARSQLILGARYPLINKVKKFFTPEPRIPTDCEMNFRP